MNDTTKLALSKLLTKLPDIPVGKTEVDEIVTLHIKGTLTRGKDCEYTPTAEIPLKSTLALLLARMGFQRDAAIELLVGAMTDAINAEDKGENFIAEKLTDIDVAMERVQKITANLPKKIRKGALTVKGTLSEIVQNVHGEKLSV